MPSISVRYIVDDMDTAISFYRDQLNFEVVMHPAPAFAMLQRDALRLLLSKTGGGPGGGGQAHGATPEPGGWNRFTLEVNDVAAEHERLAAAGVSFRSDVTDGVGGKQLLVEDPSGNPVELFQPTRDDARL